MPRRIIRAVNAFDDLVGNSADPARAAAVVDRLRLDASAEYDRDVVAALGRIISRRSMLPRERAGRERAAHQ